MLVTIGFEHVLLSHCHLRKRVVAVARLILQNKKIGSVRPSISSGVFLELDHQYFLNFGMVLETQMTLYVREPVFFRKISFAQTLRKWVKIGPKIVFF